MALIKEKIKQQNKEEYAYKKMLSYGWTPDQAAGIVGNLKYESGFNTSAEGDIGYKGGSSFGIAQFRGKRLDNLKQKYGSKWKDLDNQLDFVNWELNNTHKKVGDRLRNTQGIYNTGALISDKYEIPAKKFHENKDRQKAVYSVYEKYSGMPLTPEEFKGTAQRAIDSYNPYQETVSQNAPIYTPEVSNFVQPIEISNLAESNETEAVQKAKEELDYKQQQQINQQRFIEDLLTASQVQYVDPNQVAQEDIYNQTEDQYFQRGGRMSIPDPRLTPRDNIIRPDIDIIEPDEAMNFTLEYIQSPKYRERLIKSGYKDVDKIIDKRLKRLNLVENINQDGKPTELQKNYYDIIGKSYNPAGGSAYLGNTNETITDTKTDRQIPKFFGVGKEGVRAHELAHAEIFDTPLNKRDEDQLFDRLKEQKISSDYPLEERNAQKELGHKYQPHNFKPEENKADLNALRFLLQKEKIYDAGKETFTKEHLKKLKPNFTKSRLLENYNEEDLIWLMNNVADNNINNEIFYGKSGGKKSDPPARKEASVADSKNFTQNWYKNRKLPDADLNEIYQKEKNLYVNESQSLPNPNYVEKIDDDNTQGEYDIRTGNISLLKTASPYVYTHEATHKINLPLKDTLSNVNAFSVIGENIIPEDKIQNQWVKDNYSQISNYQEVIPRLNAYRQKYDLQPDQVITPELIQQNRDRYLQNSDYEDNTDQLYKMFENEGLSNVLNKVVSTDSANQYYGQNGGVNTSLSYNPIIEVKSSKIEGQGVFLKKDLNSGALIGLAHTNNQPSTDLGRMHNHSDNPNSESIKIGSNRFIVALKPLKQGDEITVDYRRQPELEQPEDFKEPSKTTRKRNKTKRFS